MQLVLGVPLELVHKMWRVAPLYLIGVVMGMYVFFCYKYRTFFYYDLVVIQSEASLGFFMLNGVSTQQFSSKVLNSASAEI